MDEINAAYRRLATKACPHLVLRASVMRCLSAAPRQESCAGGSRGIQSHCMLS